MNTRQEEKIIISIPKPPITSLVFEGGGVKGIAYAGAYRVLKEKGLLDQLQWVAGSSAGAMAALMVALNFTPDELEAKLTEIDFSEFAEPLPNGKLATVKYILKNKRKVTSDINHGINDGKKLYHLTQNIVEEKTGNKNATFSDLKSLNDKKNKDNNLEKLDKLLLNFKNLLVVVTNAAKKKSEIFSWETTPNLQLADAVLASMSIPIFFHIRYIDAEMHKIDWNPTPQKIHSQKIFAYVDGGVLNNYPIDIFMPLQYWPKGYYDLVKSHQFNPSSLGVRVDPKEEVTDLIEFRGQAVLNKHHSKQREEGEPRIIKIALDLILSDTDKKERHALVTVGISDCNIKTANFNLTEEDEHRLKESGEMSTKDFLKGYSKENFCTVITYNSLSELKEAVKHNNELIRLLNTLTAKGLYEHTLTSLLFLNRLFEEKILELSMKKTSVSSLFFANSAEASTSGISPMPADNASSDVTQDYKDEIGEARNVSLSDSEPFRKIVDNTFPDEKPIDVIQQESEDTIERNRTSRFRQFCLCL